MKSLIKRFEIQHNVQVIWAGYVGSKLKGYDKPGSDKDLQLIHLPKNPIKSYLLGNVKSQIDLKQDDINLISWDLKKTLSMFGKSNNKMFEMIQQENLYEGGFEETLSKLASKCFDPNKVMNCYAGIIFTDLVKGVDMKIDDAQKVKFLIRTIHSILSYKYVKHTKKIPPIFYKDLISKCDEFPKINTNLKEYLGILVNLRKHNLELSPNLLRDTWNKVEKEAIECTIIKGIDKDPTPELQSYLDEIFLETIELFDSQTGLVQK